jgi:hypothetical protein
MTFLRVARLSLAGLIAVTTLLACGGNDAIETPAPPPTETAIATAIPSLPTPPGPPPAPPPAIQVPSAVLLIDAETGSQISLFESYQDPAYTSGFDGSEVGITYRSAGEVKVDHYDLQGVLLRTTDLPPPSSDAACTESADGASVDGRTYPDTHCGQISPDRRWMTYQVPVMPRPPSGAGVPWDQWAVNLQTGDRRLLQADLQHCGGCDGRFGPKWSPGGRYLYFSELDGNGSTFLSDLQLGTTREIFRGHTDSSYEPAWSPAADVLLYPNSSETTMLEDLRAGTKRELTGLAWPARFDLSGTFVYSPAWNDPRTTGVTTAVLDLRSGAIMTLPGRVGRTSIYITGEAVQNVGGVAVAALEQVPDCDGTAIYFGDLLRHCVSGATAPSFSPDGSSVALMRRTGAAGRYSSPASQSMTGAKFEALIVDLQTGAERVVARDLIGSDMYPLPARWNEDGTHLLLQTPFLYGL